MENASKALIMAAAVLLGIMLLSIGAYLFSIFGDFSSQISKSLSQKEIDEFNAKFTKYQSYKDDDGNWQNLCRAQDIVTVANLAKENNKNYEYTNDDKNASYYITVNVNNYANNGIRVPVNVILNANILNFEQKTEEFYANFMKNNSIYTDLRSEEPCETFYRCNVTTNSITNLVNKIEFKKMGIIN